MIFPGGRANTSDVTGNAGLVGVIVVPEGFDAVTPIGGLTPLARHALSLQAAGVSRIECVGAVAAEHWAHPALTVPARAVEVTPMSGACANDEWPNKNVRREREKF